MTELNENNESDSIEFEKATNSDSVVTSENTLKEDRFKSVSVWIVCFVNLIYYADRFGIAGITFNYGHHRSLSKAQFNYFKIFNSDEL